MINLSKYKIISKKKSSNLNYYILQDDNSNNFFAKELTIEDKEIKIQIKNEIEKYNLLKDYTFIPKIVEYSKNYNYIIYEYIDGISLNKVDGIDLKKTLHIFNQLCEKVEKIHNENIVHCDLKGTNIILKDNNLYIIDFGNCHYIGEVTNYGSMVYCSIEQLTKMSITFQFDYYALAVIFYQLITGIQPYKKKNIKILMEEKKVFPKVTDYILNYPKQLDTIIDKLINKKYSNLLETIEDINEILSKMEE